MIGKVLGNRYEIVEQLGGGGMAQVYKGKDNLLNRAVTIKVLREQYANDENFIRRFQREAQAVASLSHPNIVSIYDVGQEGSMYYLVMEYVEGSNLKELIARQQKLAPVQAVDIAIQICEALEHAHNNRVIHRDIKPHNILITPRGRVKVTDFGIARAVSEATVTYTGSLVGSVQYISPEQARGEVTGTKGDIYSAGVVLYEMLTGQLPFHGESPISVALKHIQNKPQRPREIDPDIPEALEKVVLKAMEKEKELRYESAEEMKIDLLKIYQTIGDHSGFTGIVGGGPLREGNNLVKKRRRKLKPVAWLLFFILLAALVYQGYTSLKEFLFVATVEVPQVTDKSLEEAKALLLEADLKPSVVLYRNHPTVPEGHVIIQNPPAGQVVRQGRTVELDISQGPELVPVPLVIGETLRSARIKLENRDFKVAPNPEEVYHPEVPIGRVVEQDPPPDTKKPVGTEVKLVISLGPEPEYIEMPDLVGLTLEDARAKLQEVGLKLGAVSNEKSTEYFSGQVISQDVPPMERILQGQTVKLVISTGPGPGAQSATVIFRVREDGKEHLVKIVVVDLKGSREEYVRRHHGGDYVETQVNFYGKGKVQIYQDDQMVYEKPVP